MYVEAIEQDHKCFDINMSRRDICFFSVEIGSLKKLHQDKVPIYIEYDRQNPQGKVAFN
jgi:hypothetical protein